MAGDQLCVSPPGEPYIDPPPATLAPSTAITAAPVPTDVATGTNNRCGKYYQAQPDEYCNILVLKFGISLDDFLFLNSDLYQNCTNLYAYESYCVQPVGDSECSKISTDTGASRWEPSTAKANISGHAVDTYSGKPGWRPTMTSGIPYTAPKPEAPASTSTLINKVPEPSPLAKGTRDDCFQYLDGSQYQDANAIAGTYWLNQCQRVADIYNVPATDFALWNPSLGKITTADCAFTPGLRYCGKQYRGEKPAVAPGPGYIFPIRVSLPLPCEIITLAESLILRAGWCGQELHEVCRYSERLDMVRKHFAPSH